MSPMELDRFLRDNGGAYDAAPITIVKWCDKTRKEYHVFDLKEVYYADDGLIVVIEPRFDQLVIECGELERSESE